MPRAGPFHARIDAHPAGYRGVMTAQPDDGKLTLAEYLKFEEIAESRHELVRGDVRLMTGGTERHELLTNALNVQLANQLRGGRCRIFPHNRKLVTADGNAYYPDLLVACGKAADRRFEDDATLIVEVLSPSNKRDELDDKQEHYLELPSLQAYLTLDPESGVGTLYERHDLGWRSRIITRNAVVPLEGMTIDLAAAYDEVDATATT